MARASFTTPVYFFTSVRAGSGKATIVANLAVYLNSLAKKVALIDLDTETPLKLKNTFPQSISLQTYADIGQISRSDENRFQKNFYFTETSQISYFPAQKLTDPSALFFDTSLRDFFIQLKASFDVVIINFPAGIQHGQKTSELLSRTHLWRGSHPFSLIVSQSDEKSLIALDKLLQQNPAFSYQLQENTCLVFNRVPTSPEEQHLADTTLNGHELRQIFDQPNSFLIPTCEEFILQKHQSTATVLKSDSLMHQTISGLNRLLSHSGENPLKMLSSRQGEYQACLDGELLEKLSPYLEKIQAAAAARLFIHPSELQVFLEEGPGNFRIRLRIAGITQPLLGIITRIRHEPECHIIQRHSPDGFSIAEVDGASSAVTPIARESMSAISMRPVYKFPDNFSCQADQRLHPQLELLPDKPACPSPILFRQELDLPEVPSLSNVLGFTRRSYRQFAFTSLDRNLETGGVTHFFLPPEFDLSWSRDCIYDDIFYAFLSASQRERLDHQTFLPISFSWPEARDADAPELFDIFARNQKLSENRYGQVRESIPRPADFAMLGRSFYVRLNDTAIWPVPGRFITPAWKNPVLTAASLPRILQLWATKFVNREEEPATDRNFTTRVMHECESFPMEFPAMTAIYVAVRSSAMPLHMPPCHLFSLNCLCAADQPTSPELNEKFPTTKKDSPATLLIYQSALENRENYVPPGDIKLPGEFSWEDLLMDHAFIETKRIDSGRAFSGSQEKLIPTFLPAHPIFFRQNFKHGQSSSAVTELPIPTATVKLAFRSPAAALKVVAFKFLVDRLGLANDLFPVKFRHKRDISSRDAADSAYYRSDHLVDTGIRNRRFPAIKGQMLHINPQVVAQSSLPGGNSLRPLKTLISTITHDPMVILTKAANTSRISRQCHLDQLPANLFANYRPMLAILRSGSLSASQVIKNPSKSQFSVEPVDLVTISIRRDTHRFFTFKGRNISTHINHLPGIARRTFKLPSISSTKFEYKIEHVQIRIPSAIPLRNRRIDLPGLDLAGKGLLCLKIQRDMHSIIPQISIIRENIREKTTKSHSHVTGPVMLPRRYPLAVAAQRQLRSLPLKKSIFYIRFPEVLEVLFDHLRWSLKFARVCGMPFGRNFIAAKPTGEKTAFAFLQNIYTNRHLEFDDRLTIHNSMHQKPARTMYPVTNLRLRDLMNLARQTNIKFNEVSQKIQA